MTAEDTQMDNDIRQAECEVSVRSIAEQLWGGRRGPGLIYAVAELNKAALSLAETISKISTDIHGDDGLRTNMRDMRRDLNQISEDMKEQRVIVMRIIWFLAILGLANLLQNTHILLDYLKEAHP